MNDERRAELRRLCEAATPGPWTPNVWIETDGDEWRATGPGHGDAAHDHGSEPGCSDEQAAQRDAAFIAAARTAVPELLAECERLRAFEAEVLHPSMTWHNTAAVDALRDERDELRAQLASVSAARDEACDIAKCRRCSKVEEHIRIDELRAIGKEAK